MKQSFETTKLYYGFPIFILGYKDERYGYNITTSSSSYSLSDRVVVAIAADGHAISQIRKSQQFTVNIPTATDLLLVEQAGFHSGRDKVSLTDLSYSLSEKVDAPILDVCPLVLECVVDEIIEKDGFAHIFAQIVGRQVEEELLERDKLNSRSFHPIYFMGDGKERVYRYLDEEKSDALGSCLKQARNARREKR